MNPRSGRIGGMRKLLFYLAIAEIVTICIISTAFAQALFDAAKTGDIEAVKAILAKDPNVNVADANNTTALHCAAFNGKINILELLLSRGANLNAKDKWGDTPLHEGSRGGHKDVVELLLSKRSDINAQNNEGGTPIHYAAIGDHKSVLELLLAKGANVNAKNAKGITPMHFAALAGNKDIVEALLKKGASVDSQTHKGYTPLHYATGHGYKDVVELLIQNGADVNAKLENAQQPRTPLIIAAWNGHKETVRLLQENGAKDDWLSAVPGFDPNNFRPLQLGVNKDGLVSAGNIPFFLAKHYAARPWKKPDKLIASQTGNDFFRWYEPPKEERPVTMVVIEDERRNKTYEKILLPAYLGKAGVVYRDGIISIAKGGPFVDIKILWLKKIGEEAEPIAGGNVLIKRGDKSITLKTDKDGTVTHLLEEVKQNEPITAIFKSTEGTVLSTVDFDCVGRGATRESVIYMLRREETK